MNIEKVVFTVTEKRVYTITVSEENGCDMPESANELVDMVNNVKEDLSVYMREPESIVDSVIVNIESDIIECNQQG